MKVFEKHMNQGIQGDVCFTRVDSLPKNLVEVKPQNKELIVAHSESGHHHSFDADDPNVVLLENPENPLEAWLQITAPSKIIHRKPSDDAHKTVEFTEGYYRINRQRESTPEGWKRVVD